MNAEEFRPIMAYLQICSDREFDDHALNVWFDALKDLSADAVQTAAKRFALEDGERLTVAKIRRLALRQFTECCRGMAPPLKSLRKPFAVLGVMTANGQWPRCRRLFGWRFFSVVASESSAIRHLISATRYGLNSAWRLRTSPDVKNCSARCRNTFDHDWRLSSIRRR